MCGIKIDVEGEKILSIVGDQEDPLSRGYLCPKALALADIHSDPDRLKLPRKRTASGWETIGWEEAFDLAARRLHETQSQHGRHAVAVYFGNPTVHNYGAMLFGVPFLLALRSKNRFSATSVDQLPRMLASLLMYGNQLLFPIPDLDRTSYFLVLGANPVVSNGSLMTAPGASKRLAAIRARGGKVVVLDPRRTETAEIASAHHFIRPSTDALFLLGMLHVILGEGLARPGKLEPLLEGFEWIEELVRRYSPERVEGPTGIPAATIREIARAFAAAPGAACYGRVGTSAQEFGAIASWLTDVINVVTGNLDRPGGVLFTKPAADVVAGAVKAGQAGTFARYRSRVRGLPEFSGELPAAVMAEEMETPGEGQIRALVTGAGNPVLSTPNGTRLDRALAKLDFMVSIDFYVNETTRHAHLILPPTFGLEHDQYDLAFHLLAVRNTAKFSEALFERGPEQRHDWEIYLELTTRLLALRGGASRVKAAVLHAAGKRLGPGGMLDLILRAGPHGAGLNPFGGGLSRKTLARHPHGLDLGPLEPCLPERLNTKGRKIQLAPAPIVEDLKRLDARFLTGAQAPRGLELVSRRQLRSNNSWMHNSARLVRGKDRCTLLVHPLDAAERGLVTGERVRVASRVGSIVVPLEVSDEVMPGVVSLPHGWGHARAGVEQSVARAHPGESVNDLTDETHLDALCGTASLSGVVVTVEAEKPAAVVTR
jgi:anaerobic selenocysteine-containing dehydrogenase